MSGKGLRRDLARLAAGTPVIIERKRLSVVPPVLAVQGKSRPAPTALEGLVEYSPLLSWRLQYHIPSSL